MEHILQQAQIMKTCLHKYRKSILTGLVLAGIAAAWFSAQHFAAAQQRSMAEKILRLHILANSDSQEDQAVKLKVRDGVLAYMAAYAPTFHNAEEAKAWVQEHMTDLQKQAEQILRTEGHQKTVSMELAVSYFPVKTYGDLTFPQGDYQALRIKIGAAKGQNWWCVMYPPLCFVDATCAEFPSESRQVLEEQLTKDEFSSLKKSGPGAPEIRFKLLELFCSE